MLLASTPPPANFQMIHPLDIALVLVLLLTGLNCFWKWHRGRKKDKRYELRFIEVEARLKELQEIITEKNTLD